MRQYCCITRSTLVLPHYPYSITAVRGKRGGGDAAAAPPHCRTVQRHLLYGIEDTSLSSVVLVLLCCSFALTFSLRAHGRALIPSPSRRFPSPCLVSAVIFGSGRPPRSLGCAWCGVVSTFVQVERKKREAEAAERLKEEEEEWARVNEKRKADGKEEQTLEDWRKEKKGNLSRAFRPEERVACCLFL